MKYDSSTKDFYSIRLHASLKIGVQYKLDYIASLIDRETQAIRGKGVVNRSDSDFLVLFVTLKKTTDATQYVDWLEGSTLSWEGQNSMKTAEGYIQRGCRNIFVFIRPVARIDFTYYGKALPKRFQMQLDRSLKIPSKVVYELYEYAELLERKGLVVPNEAISSPPPEGIYAPTKKPFETEDIRIHKIRIAQSTYRNSALGLWHNECVVTGVDELSWLIASHIKPWREASPIERVDKYNSLILTPDYDKLFDRGVISFNDSNGRIFISKAARSNSHLMSKS